MGMEHLGRTFSLWFNAVCFPALRTYLKELSKSFLEHAALLLLISEVTWTFWDRKQLQTGRNLVWDRLFSFHVCEGLHEWEVSNADIFVKLISSYQFPTVKSYRNCGLFQYPYPLITETMWSSFLKKGRGYVSNLPHSRLKVTGEMTTEYLLLKALSKACLWLH